MTLQNQCAPWNIRIPIDEEFERMLSVGTNNHFFVAIVEKSPGELARRATVDMDRSISTDRQRCENRLDQTSARRRDGQTSIAHPHCDRGISINKRRSWTRCQSFHDENHRRGVDRHVLSDVQMQSQRFRDDRHRFFEVSEDFFA